MNEGIGIEEKEIYLRSILGGVEIRVIDRERKRGEGEEWEEELK